MGSAGINAGIFYTSIWYKLYHVKQEETAVMPVFSRSDF